MLICYLIIGVLGLGATVAIMTVSNDVVQLVFLINKCIIGNTTSCFKPLLLTFKYIEGREK